MPDPRDPTLGERNYESFAERYAATVPTKPHNAYYERPATRALLPDVAGRDMLDAGCGPGTNSEWLLAQGARVTAFDVTQAFVRMTEARLGGRAGVLRADLLRALPFADASFDAVLAALVLDYIEDWRPLMAEFHRVLRPGGVVVFSAGHPMGDYRWLERRGIDPGSYFDTVYFEVPWVGFGDPPPVIGSYRRSFSEMIHPVLEAGLTLDAFVEPLPTEQFRQADPERYERLMRMPGFVCIRARKPNT